MQYYYSADGADVNGPVTAKELEQMYANNTLTDEAQICAVGTETWLAINVIGIGRPKSPTDSQLQSAIESLPKQNPKSIPLAIGLNFVLPGAGYMYMGRFIAGIGCMLFLALLVFAGGAENGLVPATAWLSLAVVMAIDMIILGNKRNKRIQSATTKQCPRCAETIQQQAEMCRFCGAEL